MNKIIIAILSLVMIIGCSGGGEDNTVTNTESPYIGGNQGIIAEFLEMGVYNDETNIEEIFDGESFPIEVMIKNKGEEDVVAGDLTITLKGIALADFSGIATNGVLSNTDLIESVSEYNDAGGEITLDFTTGTEDAKYESVLNGAHYDVSVFGEVVYKYATYASVPEVCFKEDLQDDSICKVDEMKTVYSSAAPIQIRKAEEKRAGTGKIAVEFEVENVGGGAVAKPGTDFDSRYDQLSFAPGDSLWECKAGGRLNEGRFDSNNKITIVCKLITPMAEDTLYTKSLDLKLEYKYKELISRQVRIRAQ